MSDSVLVSSGEIRTGLLELIDPDGRPIRILTAAPGHLLKGFDGRADVLRRADQSVSRRNAFSFRESLLSEFGTELDHLPQTAEWEDRLRRWLARLDDQTVQAVHRPDVPIFTRLLSFPERTVVTSGPLTAARAENSHDLNLELTGAENVKARTWFIDHFRRGEDITADVANSIRESWAGELVDPMDLYYKVLTDYFSHTIEGMDMETDDNSMLEYLTDFQRDAYEYAKGIMRRFGGVFLADVVGLGKTFIGLALLKHLQQRYGEHAVVIAPPKVCAQWEELAAEFRVELVTVSHGSLEQLSRYSDREVLLIDESHNFRNRGTLRYDNVTDWLRPEGAASSTKVILLSATPQNNRASDVKHQLEFFPDTYARLPYRGESLDGWFATVERGDASLSDLLQHVVVRRTRSFVKRHYPNTTLRRRTDAGDYETIPLEFPARVSGEEQALRYSIEATYGSALYGRILSTLGDLSYAVYNLASYVLPEYQDLPELSGLRNIGKSLRGLFKVLLLKRLESSIYAFATTTERLSAKLFSTLERLQLGTVQIRDADQPDGDDDSLDRVVSDAPVRWFDKARLAKDLSHDIELVDRLSAEVQQLFQDGSIEVGAKADAKLRELERYLNARRPTEHRTIVFTQFADTANYLSLALGQRFGRTAVVTGSTPNGLSYTRRFAPKASRVDVPPKQQIDLLISTDALSEGVNLQDADTLINYDIHWNPVRLIQRAGRIDRIGSENDEIHIASFLPERTLEAELGLEAVLRARIREFLDVFGEDSAILPAGESLEEGTMVSAYSGEALEQLEEGDQDLDGLSRHAERLLTLRREDPARYNRVIEFRPGRRASSAADQPIAVATRVGWHWAFWVPDLTGVRRLDDDQDGLDLLFRHAVCGPNDTPPGSGTLDELRSTIHVAFDAFRDESLILAQQRRRPRLSPTEDFLVTSLELYLVESLSSERPLVERVLDWVRTGVAQARLRRMCRGWKKQRLPPSTVFTELRVLFERYPPIEEELGEPIVVGSVVGTATFH